MLLKACGSRRATVCRSLLRGLPDRQLAPGRRRPPRRQRHPGHRRPAPAAVRDADRAVVRRRPLAARSRGQGAALRTPAGTLPARRPPRMRAPAPARRPTGRPAAVPGLFRLPGRRPVERLGRRALAADHDRDPAPAGPARGPARPPARQRGPARVHPRRRIPGAWPGPRARRPAAGRGTLAQRSRTRACRRPRRSPQAYWPTRSGPRSLGSPRRCPQRTLTLPARWCGVRSSTSGPSPTPRTPPRGPTGSPATSPSTPRRAATGRARWTTASAPPTRSRNSTSTTTSADSSPPHGSLGGRPHLAELRLRAWAHTLGFRGHWASRSRRYSTTLKAIRLARQAWHRQHATPPDTTTVRVGQWRYLGRGHRTAGDAWLAATAGQNARQARELSRLDLAIAA